jgi:hypothetical protein
LIKVARRIHRTYASKDEDLSAVVHRHAALARPSPKSCYGVRPRKALKNGP